jgi:hypothetical protein
MAAEKPPYVLRWGILCKHVFVAKWYLISNPSYQHAAIFQPVRDESALLPFFPPLLLPKPPWN